MIFFQLVFFCGRRSVAPQGVMSLLLIGVAYYHIALVIALSDLLSVINFLDLFIRNSVFCECICCMLV
jgi:hypothetical protein